LHFTECQKRTDLISRRPPPTRQTALYASAGILENVYKKLYSTFGN
jgi:hypothetical protein